MDKMEIKRRDARAKIILSIACAFFFMVGFGEITRRAFFDINDLRDSAFGLSSTFWLTSTAILFGLPLIACIILAAKFYKEWKSLK